MNGLRRKNDAMKTDAGIKKIKGKKQKIKIVAHSAFKFLLFTFDFLVCNFY
jgi:hypothetical protein